MTDINKLIDAYLNGFGGDNKYLLSELEKQMAKLYSKYAKDNKMSYEDALKYLTDDEREEFQYDVEWYLEKIRDKEFVSKNKQLLQSLSVRARVKRLETLKAEIVKASNELYSNLKEGSETLMSDIGKQSIKNLLETTPKDAIDFGNIQTDPNKMKTLLEYPFQGENYSERIWGDCANFERELNTTLTNGLVTGKPYSEIVDELHAKFDKEKWKIDRLVRTEGNFINNQTQLNQYRENGVEYYRFVARIDERTSPECKAHDGKIYRVEDAMAGDNLPPLHPYCRSTTVPVFDLERELEKGYKKGFKD